MYIVFSSINFHKNYIGGEWIKNSVKKIHNNNFDPYKQHFWVNTKLTKDERAEWNFKCFEACRAARNAQPIVAAQSEVAEDNDVIFEGIILHGQENNPIIIEDDEIIEEFPLPEFVDPVFNLIYNEVFLSTNFYNI